MVCAALSSAAMLSTSCAAALCQSYGCGRLDRDYEPLWHHDHDCGSERHQLLGDTPQEQSSKLAPTPPAHNAPHLANPFVDFAVLNHRQYG